ncbi:MAG TPA: hypothetical protein VGC54_10840 [Planctomycetota bacterium]
MMVRCNQLVATLSDHIEGRLGWFASLQIRFHLWMCPVCKVYFKQFERIYRECGQVDLAELPGDFEKVMSQILAKWKSGPATEVRPGGDPTAS